MIFKNLDLWFQLLSPIDSSSFLISQGKSATKVFQQLNINMDHKDNVKDLFNKRKTVRRTIRKSTRKSTLSSKTRTSMRSAIS